MTETYRQFPVGGCGGSIRIAGKESVRVSIPDHRLNQTMKTNADMSRKTDVVVNSCLLHSALFRIAQRYYSSFFATGHETLPGPMPFFIYQYIMIPTRAFAAAALIRFTCVSK
jgi:hypothetical protein